MLRIPLAWADDLPWGYFVLQAARGSVRVPDWVLLAIPEVVGLRLGIPPDDVTDEDVERALRQLPADPVPVLSQLLSAVDLEVPDPSSAEPRLGADEAQGSFREAVDHVALLHDAALQVRQQYGPEGFFSSIDASSNQERWDARGAVAAVMYLLVLFLG